MNGKINNSEEVEGNRRGRSRSKRLREEKDPLNGVVIGEVIGYGDAAELQI